MYCITLTTKSLVSIHYHTVEPLYPFCSPSFPFLSSNHQSVVCLYTFVFVLFVHLFLYSKDNSIIYM